MSQDETSHKEKMQGLPAHLLTPTGKVAKSDSLASKNVIGKSNEEKSSSSGSFSSMFSSIVGSEGKASGEAESKESKDSKGLNALMKGEELLGEKAVKKDVTKEAKKENSNPELKIDMMLKAQSLEQEGKGKAVGVTTEQAMPAHVLKNVDNLLAAQVVKEAGKSVPEKVAATSSNLDQLLNTLKGNQGEIQVDNEEGKALDDAPLKKSQKDSVGSPLEFLIMESKGSDVGSASTVAPQTFSKLGLSGEDFVKNLEAADSKELKDSKKDEALKIKGFSSDEVLEKSLTKNNLENDKLGQIAQKQLNHSMKSYGQKQDLLSNNLIKNTNDLALKDKKSNASVDELKQHDLKIASDLSSMKEPLIPLMMKQESQANLETKTPSQVLDLSKINTSNTNEIIKKISDYIEQSQVAGKDSIDLTVKHESLGQFKIQVNKQAGAGPAQMDMQITTTTPEGHDFFMKNEIGLMKNLSQAGIQLSDLKIVSSGSETMNFGQNDSRSGNSQAGNQGPREFMSFDSGNSSQGSERRKALWEEYQQRYGA